MPNEVTIAVTMMDDTAAGREAVKASWKTTGESLPPLRVTATNPIDEAWRAQVNAEIKAAAKDALVIPVEADTSEMRANFADTLAALKTIAREPVPLGAADADVFRSSVLAAVQETRAEIQATVQPVVIPVEAEQVPDLSGSRWPTSDPDQASLRPSAAAAGGPFGAGGDPYAQARQSLASEPAIEVPVVAANPITEAWRTQVAASIRSISSDAVKIPVGADTDAFREQVMAGIAELSDVRENIPLEVANGPEFQAQVMEQAQILSQQVKVVIDVDPNTASLGELRANILAAADASQEEVKAQQELASAMQAVNADGSAKNMAALAQAEQNAAASSEEAAKAQQAMAGGLREATIAEDAAAEAGRGLGAAMGPLWMIMNVAQIAMFAFGSSSTSTAQQVQDASQQIIGLGQAAGTAATSLVGGNQGLQKTNAELTTLGTSSTAFAQAYSGNLAAAGTYTQNLAARQTELGSATMKLSEIGGINTRAQIDMGRSSGDTLITIADLTDKVNSNSAAYAELSPAAKQAVDQFNALHDIVPQAQNALEGAQAAAVATAQTLASLGFVMSAGQTAANNYGLGVQAAAKALQDATSGATYLENATDKASIAAGQGVQQWGQLQAAVSSAGQQVAAASHSVVTAEQGVEAARHSEQQSVLAVKTAQDGYTNALYQQVQAQNAVTAAQATAEQQLISLKLQANDAAESTLSANTSLFDAQQAAAAVDVTPGNAQAMATMQLTTWNEVQVKAAQALLAAQNQVADAQNSASTSQASLTTAQAQGVAGNPAVLSAQHALAQASDAVASSADGVTNAQYAEQQAAIAVGNAEYGVKQAVDQLHTSQIAYKTAVDDATRSTDAATLAGAQNRQMLENIYIAYENATGNAQVAAQMTEQVGQKMGFTNTQIGNVVNSLNGLNGTNVNFSLTGTPSLNAQALVAVGNQLGMSFAQIEQTLPTQATGRAKAAGGAGGGLTWVGEYGQAELVEIPPGATVHPHANSMMKVASGEVPPPGKAAGGPVGVGGVLGENLPIAAQWGALDVVGQALHALGGPPVTLPAAGSVDWGAFGNRPGSVPTGSVPGVPSSRAANEAAVQSVFAGYGWGAGAEWDAAIKLIMMESGFNNTAQNPTSSAYGIFQFLNSTWAGYGIQKTSDPHIQAVGGARYIDAGYHDPLGALAHENAFHWYRNGGATSGGLVGMNDGGGELAILPNGSTIRPHANSQPEPAPLRVEVNLNFVGNTNTAAASSFMGLVRSGAVQLSAVVNGTRVKVQAG